MVRSYNHSEIEDKWSKIWDENPINKKMNQKRNIIVSICFLILQVVDFM